MNARAAAALALAALTAAGCGRAAAPAPVRVFAAASLAEAFRAIGAELERARPGLDVELHLAGSQLLRAQIEQGAAADVYAFADLVEAEALQRAGLVQPHRVFARNRLCVVTPIREPRVRALADLAAPGVRVVLAAAEVPAGRYAERVLDGLERSGQPGFAAAVRANVVSREASVRAALAKVALDEADAAIVYVTDATAGNVRRLDLPDTANVSAQYPIGFVGGSPPEAARAFVDAVLGPGGQAVLARHGFERP